MKTLFRTALLLVCGFPLFACTPHAASDAPYRIEEGTIVFAEPARAEGQCDVLQLRCDPIPVVRVAFIGLGMRGSTAVERFTQLDGVEIVAPSSGRSGRFRYMACRRRRSSRAPTTGVASASWRVSI